VSKLLPRSAENELASQCSWPDDVRKVIPWSSALHFADTADSVCSYDHTSKLLSIFCSKRVANNLSFPQSVTHLLKIGRLDSLRL